MTAKRFNEEFPGGIISYRKKQRREFTEETDIWSIVLSRAFSSTMQLLLETIDANPNDKAEIVKECLDKGNTGSFAAMTKLAFYGCKQEWIKLLAQKSFFQIFSLLFESLSSLIKFIFASVQVLVRFIAVPFDFAYEKLALWGRTNWLAKGCSWLMSIPLDAINRVANVIGYSSNLIDGGLKLATSSPLRFLKLVESGILSLGAKILGSLTGSQAIKNFATHKFDVVKDAWYEFWNDLLYNGAGRVLKNSFRLAPEAVILGLSLSPAAPLAPAAQAMAQFVGGGVTATAMEYVLLGGIEAATSLLPYDRFINNVLNASVYIVFNYHTSINPKEGAVAKYNGLPPELTENSNANESISEQSGSVPVQYRGWGWLPEVPENGDLFPALSAGKVVINPEHGLQERASLAAASARMGHFTSHARAARGAIQSIDSECSLAPQPGSVLSPAAAINNTILDKDEEPSSVYSCG